MVHLCRPPAIRYVVYQIRVSIESLVSERYASLSNNIDQGLLFSNEILRFNVDHFLSFNLLFYFIFLFIYQLV
jgi:hypothetical protein